MTPNESSKIRVIAEWALIVAFMAAVAAPCLGGFTNADRVAGKKLVERIRWELHSGLYADIPETFQKYFTSHFGFRTEMVLMHGLVKLKWFGVSPSARVVVGKDGWFFLNDGTIDDYRNVNPLSPQELGSWRAAFDYNRKMYAASGAAYIFVVAPNSHTIYSEFLPGELNKVNPMSRFDQILGVAGEKRRSNAGIIDLRPALFEAKKHNRIYFKTDTHWNEIGGFVMYRAVMNAVGKSYPGVEPRPRSDYRVVNKVVWNSDLINMMGLAGRLHDVEYRMEPIRPRRVEIVRAWNDGRNANLITRCDEGELPSALIIHDSFMDYSKFFIAQHFRKAYFYSNPDGKLAYYPGLARRVRPSVVIEEVVERNLGK